MEAYLEQIEALESQLSGDLYSDLDIQQQIYELKKEMADAMGVSIEQIEEDFDFDCLSCGS